MWYCLSLLCPIQFSSHNKSEQRLRDKNVYVPLQQIFWANPVKSDLWDVTNPTKPWRETSQQNIARSCQMNWFSHEKAYVKCILISLVSIFKAVKIMRWFKKCWNIVTDVTNVALNSSSNYTTKLRGCKMGCILWSDAGFKPETSWNPTYCNKEKCQMCQLFYSFFSASSVEEATIIHFAVCIF